MSELNAIWAELIPLGYFPEDIELETYDPAAVFKRGGMGTGQPTRAVRLTHKPTGQEFCGESERNQHLNRMICMRDFLAWAKEQSENDPR